MIESADLRHGRTCPLPEGSVGVISLSDPAPGDPPLARLSVLPADGPETQPLVGVGDTFAIGPELWSVEQIEDNGGYDYVVRIAPVSAS